MGGGGDDFTAQTAASEAKKQQARDALNLQFGVMPSSGPPTIDQYTTTTPGGSGGDSESGNAGGGASPSSTTVDQSGFDAALASYNALGPQAAANKAAQDALYSGVRDDTYNAGLTKLDDAQTAASRNLKFTLFGQGLNGGSEDINQNALLNRTYDQGKLELGAKADAAEADLKSNDESTRLGLLQSIDSGLDQSSALSSSLNSLAANSDKAAADAQGTDLGDLFANAGLIYSSSQAGKGVADARAAYAPLFGSSSSTGGLFAPSRKGAAGTISAIG